MQVVTTSVAYEPNLLERTISAGVVKLLVF